MARMSASLSPLLTDLHPPERRVLHEQVLAQLLDALRHGRLRPGDRLLEAEIAGRLGLSRGAVREAVRRLEQEGLVVTQPHRGTYVVRLTAADVAEVYSLRLLLEAYAVRLAAPRVTPAALAELAAHVEAMAVAAEREDRHEQIRRDQCFHEQICLLSGHRHLHDEWSRLALKLRLVNFTLRPGFGVGARARALAHGELIELLRRGETEAAIGWIEAHIGGRAREAVAQIAAREGGETGETADGHRVIALACRSPGGGATPGPGAGSTID
jgi:DNA-binding GntR family transcriptional regulator